MDPTTQQRALGEISRNFTPSNPDQQDALTKVYDAFRPTIASSSTPARSLVSNLNERISTSEKQSQEELDAVASLRDTSGKNQDEIKRQRASLDQRRADEESLINTLFAQTEGDLKAKQEKEFASRRTGLITSGGYLGTTQSQEGALANLAASHRAEVSSLTLKKLQAIREARNAYEDRDFKLADKALEEAKTLDSNIIKLRKDFADQALAAAKEKRSESNQLRDDARSALTQILTNFGGAAIEDLDPESLSYLGDLADTAGVPRRLLEEQFRTLREKSMDATQDQREKANLLSEARLAIASANLAISQSREERAGQISDLAASRLGLPKAVVGLSEKQVYNDMRSEKVPTWFEEAERTKAGDTVIPENDLKKRWNDFRQKPVQSGYQNVLETLINGGFNSATSTGGTF